MHFINTCILGKICNFIQKNRIHCLSNFKAQIECENIDFNADKIKQYEAVRKAMNSASMKISSLSLQIRLSS